MSTIPAIADLLASDDVELRTAWDDLQARLAKRFGDDASIEVILFLVGVQARGTGYSPDLEKEDKQTLIMEGTYHVMAAIGQYEAIASDDDGQSRWTRTQSLPTLSRAEQEKLLQIAILRYFETQF